MATAEQRRHSILEYVDTSWRSSSVYDELGSQQEVESGDIFDVSIDLIMLRSLKARGVPLRFTFLEGPEPYERKPFTLMEKCLRAFELLKEVRTGGGSFTEWKRDEGKVGHAILAEGNFLAREVIHEVQTTPEVQTLRATLTFPELKRIEPDIISIFNEKLALLGDCRWDDKTKKQVRAAFAENRSEVLMELIHRFKDMIDTVSMEQNPDLISGSYHSLGHMVKLRRDYKKRAQEILEGLPPITEGEITILVDQVAQRVMDNGRQLKLYSGPLFPNVFNQNLW